MNAFANTLFSLLLGWVRSIIQMLWSTVNSSGNGFLTWLGDHWLSLTITLMIIGTVLDMVVWFVRWQPFKLWRSKLHRIHNKFRHADDLAENRAFQHGYVDAIDYPLYEETPEMPIQNQQPNTQIYYDAEMESNEVDEPQNMLYEEFAPTPDSQVQMFYNAPPVRKRRSDAHKKSSNLKQILFHNKLSSDDQEGMLDGLPPVIDKDAAFHAPVYPNQPTNAQWPPANNGVYMYDHTDDELSNGRKR